MAVQRITTSDILQETRLMECDSKMWRGIRNFRWCYAGKQVFLHWICLSWIISTVVAYGEIPGCSGFYGEVTPMIEACCASDALVDDRTVGVEYFLRGNEFEGSWGLDAFITWDPVNTTGPARYEVSWRPLVSVEELITIPITTFGVSRQTATGSCMNLLFTDMPLPCGDNLVNSVITEEPELLTSDVRFGFQYRFRVRALDGDNVPAGITFCLDPSVPDTDFVAPDCYAETEDLDFCEDEPIVLSSEPLNATIVITSRGMNDLGTINASLTWMRPVQVNGRVEAYTISRAVEDELPDSVGTILTSLNDTEDTVYEQFYDDLVNGTDYVFQIIPRVRPSIGDFVGLGQNPFFLPEGNIRSMDFEAYIPDPCFPDNCLNGGVCFPSTDNPEFGYSCVCPRDYSGQDCEQVLGSPVPPARSPSSPTPEPFPATIVAIAAGVVVIVTVALCLFCVVFTRLRKPPPKNATEGPYTFAPQFVNRAYASSKNRMELVSPDFKAVEICDYSHIKEGERLGSGQYGEVFKGEARLQGQKKWTVVAIKKPKNAISEEVIDDFKNEIRLMLELGKHPNIVGVLGCCTVDEPYYLLTDFMRHGDLLHFLRKCTDEEAAKTDSIYKINTFNQLQIARQIVDGMAYVSQTRFFHGDLAARNILVGEDLIIKITDFGLTDDLYQKGYTRLQAGAKRPYKWYSPESIEHQYCTGKTDIWSFGVLMWEILTFGRQTPYHGMSIGEVLHRLKSGYRMPCPPQTPHFMEKLINSCWQLEPERRPEFPNLLESISFLLTKGSADLNYIEAGEDEPGPPTEKQRKTSLIYVLNLHDVDPSEVSGSADSAYIGSGSGLSAASFMTSNTFSAGSVEPLIEEEEGGAEEESEVKEARVTKQGDEVKVDIDDTAVTESAE